MGSFEPFDINNIPPAEGGNQSKEKIYLTGRHHGKIIKFEEGITSAKGRTYDRLTLLVKTTKGNAYVNGRVNYPENNDSAQKKHQLRFYMSKFAKCFDLPTEPFLAGNLTEQDVLGREGDVMVKIEEWVSKAGKTGKSNVVEEWLPAQKNAAPATPAQTKITQTQENDSDIPF